MCLTAFLSPRKRREHNKSDRKKQARPRKKIKQNKTKSDVKGDTRNETGCHKQVTLKWPAVTTADSPPLSDHVPDATIPIVRPLSPSPDVFPVNYTLFSPKRRYIPRLRLQPRFTGPIDHIYFP